MTVTSLLEFRLAPETRDEGLEHLRTVLKDTRAFQGCTDLEVLIDDTDPAHVLIIERWESMDDDLAYRAWRATPEGASDLGKYLAGAPTLVKYVTA
ncbi:putative quinol monooxygenase [Nakamurella leprariae]|uniref:Antibiotic biosynthesis monooxygenase n=1 Tax=Nakamurella leprariae TaxID=2803911 RepID=A0A938YH36_9ACTN|nr:antibiotic biosynthesis monooxygenase family protein [Nakamurella leprariae]MBM9469386.1 antibiotic biosynthesis monooxygenase [Nakamurella leprariae]